LAVVKRRDETADLRAPTLNLGVRVWFGLSLDGGEQTS